MSTTILCNVCKIETLLGKFSKSKCDTCFREIKRLYDKNFRDAVRSDPKRLVKHVLTQMTWEENNKELIKQNKIKKRDSLTDVQKAAKNELNRIAYAKKNSLSEAENKEINEQWIELKFDTKFTDPKLSFRRKRYIIKTELESRIPLSQKIIILQKESDTNESIKTDFKSGGSSSRYGMGGWMDRD